MASRPSATVGVDGYDTRAHPARRRRRSRRRCSACSTSRGVLAVRDPDRFLAAAGRGLRPGARVRLRPDADPPRSAMSGAAAAGPAAAPADPDPRAVLDPVHREGAAGRAGRRLRRGGRGRHPHAHPDRRPGLPDAGAGHAGQPRRRGARGARRHAADLGRRGRACGCMPPASQGVRGRIVCCCRRVSRWMTTCGCVWCARCMRCGSRRSRRNADRWINCAGSRVCGCGRPIKLLAQRHGVHWDGRQYDPHDWSTGRYW